MRANSGFVSVGYVEEALKVSNRDARALLSVFRVQEVLVGSVSPGRPRKQYPKLEVDRVINLIDGYLDAKGM